jgi:hypothetical protein
VNEVGNNFDLPLLFSKKRPSLSIMHIVFRFHIFRLLEVNCGGVGVYKRVCKFEMENIMDL